MPKAVNLAAHGRMCSTRLACSEPGTRRTASRDTPLHRSASMYRLAPPLQGPASPTPSSPGVVSQAVLPPQVQAPASEEQQGRQADGPHDELASVQLEQLHAGAWVHCLLPAEPEAAACMRGLGGPLLAGAWRQPAQAGNRLGTAPGQAARSWALSPAAGPAQTASRWRSSVSCTAAAKQGLSRVLVPTAALTSRPVT